MKRVPVLATVAAFIVTAAACSTAPAPQTMTVAAAEPDVSIAVTAGESPVSCRHILVFGTSVPRIVCGTELQWEDYERRLAWASQDLVLRLQGASHSGGY